MPRRAFFRSRSRRRPRGPLLGTMGTLLLLLAAAPGSSEEYRLGPGDVVKISVYNNPDLATEAEISDSGEISFPLLGEVALGGLTRTEAERTISSRLHQGGFVPNASVNLLVTLYRSRQVSVLGEVHKPGKYPIQQLSSVTDLLAAAGGITEKGSSVVTVIRRDANGNATRREIDIKQLLRSGDLSGNLLVGAGDIVYVPPAPVFYIYGEVRQPGVYPLAPDMTVRQALSVGGGLTVRGTERGIRLDRKGPDGKLHSYRARLSDKLQPDDVLHVPESWF
ncbi:polysaccharide export protein EpsE [Pelomicrobium sp.]|jgi:polysaccharide export outer membrane protein|uniref:polysaccharide export protein EpsE n=1 Tax=Pelomicrobium sp. TaxID=2815319 RepID=UPI002FDED208